MNLKVFTSKFAGTGPSFYKQRIYRAAVSQSLRNTVLYEPFGCGQCCLVGELPTFVQTYLQFGGTCHHIGREVHVLRRVSKFLAG